MGHQPNKSAVTIGPGDRHSMARGSRLAQAIRGIQQLAIAATISHRNGETTLAVMHRQWQRPGRHGALGSLAQAQGQPLLNQPGEIERGAQQQPAMQISARY